MVTVTLPVTIPDTRSRTYRTFAGVVSGARSRTGGAPRGSSPGFQAPTGLNSAPSMLPSTMIGPVNEPRHKKQVSSSDPVGGMKSDVSTTGVRPLKPPARLAIVPNPFWPASSTPETSHTTPTAPAAPDRSRTALNAPGIVCLIPSGPSASNEATVTNV